MIMIMITILFAYFAFSGSFNTSASYDNILSLSKYSQCAKGDGWTLYMPKENDDLSPYFTYEGTNTPRQYVSAKAVLYFGAEHKAKKVEWLLYGDRHFFFGQRRFFFPEPAKDLSAVAFKIGWVEYSDGDENFAYVFSKSLTDREKSEALSYIDNLKIFNNKLPAI